MLLAHLGALPDVSSVGLSPYTIAGNPNNALVAQVNRFAGRRVKPVGCSERQYVKEAFPLAAVVPQWAAHAANQIFIDSHTCLGDQRLVDKYKVQAALTAQQNDSQWLWATSNLTDVTTRIAQFADSLGLDPAPVGITQRDPNIPLPPKKFPVVTTVLLTALAIGAFVLTRSAR